MVSGARPRVPAALALGLVLAGAIGCAGDPVGPRGAPVLYVLLNPSAPPASVDARRAYVLRTRTAALLEYAEAERFEMRRASDGARFDWRSLGLRGATPDPNRLPLDEANYELPERGGARGLGFADLEAGESYTLEVRLGGTTVRGAVRAPDSFDLRLEAIGDSGLLASWPRVMGAEGYFVRSGRGTAYTRDTSFRFDRRAVPGERVTVQALDPNAWRYLRADSVLRAGLDAGMGLFGALSEATAALGGDG